MLNISLADLGQQLKSDIIVKNKAATKMDWLTASGERDIRSHSQSLSMRADLKKAYRLRMNLLDSDYLSKFTKRVPRMKMPKLA